jgi:hypothetical protein
LFAVRFFLNARQRNSLSCIFFLGARQTHPPTGCCPRPQPLTCALSLPCARTRRTIKTISLPCAVGKCTTNYLFAVHFPTAHDKHIRLPCVFLRHTPKYFFKNWILYFFLFLHYKNIILYSTPSVPKRMTF